MNWKKYLLWPIRSRKVQIAVAAALAAWLAEAGLELSDEMVATIVALGAALILGIAHEDNGTKSAGPPAPEARDGG